MSSTSTHRLPAPRTSTATAATTAAAATTAIAVLLSALGLLVALGAAEGHGAPPEPARSAGQAEASARSTGQPGKGQPGKGQPGPWKWQLPPGFPEPWVPADNPMTVAKVELGRALFFDPRLSADGTMSCATCHRPELAFTDGQARSIGVTGEAHPRSASSLINIAYARTLTWDDPALDSLEEQLRTPLFGHLPIEMGAPRSEELMARLADDWLTVLQFQAAFPDDPEPMRFDNLAKAIAAFERTLISGASPFDRYWHQGEADALSSEARRGMRLFFSRRLACSDCHAGFLLSGPVRFRGSSERPGEFHNTRLYDLDTDGDGVPDGAYPPDNRGLMRHTGLAADMGRFRAPSLRNIELTAPYMHDGSIATLDAVLDHYAAGGRSRAHGPRNAENALEQSADGGLRGFRLSSEERRDLLAFLRSLTDPEVATSPRFAAPGGSTAGDGASSRNAVGSAGGA